MKVGRKLKKGILTFSRFFEISHLWVLAFFSDCIFTRTSYLSNHWIQWKKVRWGTENVVIGRQSIKDPLRWEASYQPVRSFLFFLRQAHFVLILTVVMQSIRTLPGATNHLTRNALIKQNIRRTAVGTIYALWSGKLKEGGEEELHSILFICTKYQKDRFFFKQSLLFLCSALKDLSEFSFTEQASVCSQWHVSLQLAHVQLCGYKENDWTVV